MRFWFAFLFSCVAAVGCGPSSGVTTDDGSDAGVDAEVQIPDDDRYLAFVRVPMEGEPAQITDFAFIPAPDGEPSSELLATTRDARLLHYELGDEGAALLGELEVPGVYQNRDCGLISLALSPSFRDDGYVYLGQCFSLTETGVVRIPFSPPAYAIASNDVVEILRVGEPAADQPWHNVGSIGFEDDGALWALVGDKTVRARAADPSHPLGSILRVVPLPEGGHAPAPGNPHEEDPRFHPDVWAYGLRSPWKGFLEESAGRRRFVVGDVGNLGVEEVNVVDRPGAFLGWPLAEGPCGDECDVIRDEVVDPVVHWVRRRDHAYVSEDPFATPNTGRVAWVGRRYPADHPRDRYQGWLDDAVLFGDACVGFVRLLGLDAEGARTRDEPAGHLAGASGFALGPGGYVYATSFGRCTAIRDAVYLPGGFWRAELTGRPVGLERPSGFPELFSEYGLFPEAPVLENVPSQALFFEPAWPLWTNGLGKIRHVVIADGLPLQRSGDRYLLPEGTLIFKTFLADGEGGLSGPGRPVETRVIRIEEEGVSYAGYLWNEEGTEATRLDLDEPVSVAVEVGGESVIHEVPSAAECATCHEAGEHEILGLIPRQLEGSLEAPDDETRAIFGWALGNCVHCHDGSGGPLASFSLRPENFLANTIGQPTESSASGGGIRIVPGDPEASALYIAFAAIEDGSGLREMPPLSVQFRDEESLGLLREWIESLEDD